MGTLLNKDSTRGIDSDVSIEDGSAGSIVDNYDFKSLCVVESFECAREWLLNCTFLQLTVGHGHRWNHLVQSDWL
jgi:hypothetical protein